MGHLLLNGMNMCHRVLVVTWSVEVSVSECAVDLVGIYMEIDDVAQPYFLVAVLQPHTTSLQP